MRSAPSARRCTIPPMWQILHARSSRGPDLKLDGLMAYEGQIAGVGDRPPGKPLMRLALPHRCRRCPRASCARRRARDRRRGARDRAAALRQRRRDGLDRAHRGRARRDRGGGRLRACSGRRCSTPTAPSGPRPPRCSRCRSCASRRAKLATALGGGYPASGPAGRDRLPRPLLPAGLKLDAREGAGEVQTPLRGQGGRRAAGRRPRVVPPRQGGRAVRALRRRAPDRRAESSWAACRPTAARARRFFRELAVVVVEVLAEAHERAFAPVARTGSCSSRDRPCTRPRPWWRASRTASPGRMR